jgi:hypothetical protein
MTKKKNLSLPAVVWTSQSGIYRAVLMPARLDGSPEVVVEGATCDAMGDPVWERTDLGPHAQAIIADLSGIAWRGVGRFSGEEDQ